MIRLSSTQELLAAVRSAHDVSLTAYTMPQGAVLDGLVAAAERGTHVRVRLEGWIYREGDTDGWTGSALQANRAAVSALKKAGADAELLTHLRGPGPHVRGCHVVDLLTGRK